MLTRSYNDALQTRYDPKTGELYVKFGGEYYEVFTHVHTHPSEASEIAPSEADILVIEMINRPINIIYNKQTYSVDGTFDYKKGQWNHNFKGSW